MPFTSRILIPTILLITYTACTNIISVTPKFHLTSSIFCPFSSSTLSLHLPIHLTPNSLPQIHSPSMHFQWALLLFTHSPHLIHFHLLLYIYSRCTKYLFFLIIKIKNNHVSQPLLSYIVSFPSVIPFQNHLPTFAVSFWIPYKEKEKKDGMIKKYIEVY